MCGFLKSFYVFGYIYIYIYMQTLCVCVCLCVYTQTYECMYIDSCQPTFGYIYPFKGIGWIKCVLECICPMSSLFVYVCLSEFYGIWTFVGNLIPNPFLYK